MARLPFVDTHTHFWDFKYPKLRYDWLSRDSVHPIMGDIDGLKVSRYTAPEYTAETRFHNVAKVVHVQAAFGIEDPVEETRWVQSIADRYGLPNGIIAYCDFADSAAPKTIERHLQYAGLRGFREIAPVDCFDDPAWRRGYALLARYGLVFCHEVGWENMGRAQALARDFPDIVFCVDQAGMPTSRTADYFEHWRQALHVIAAEPNVVCKICSLGMGDPRWTVASLRPWVLTCIETFGVDRCFFGSNWPVDRLFSSYGDLIDAYDDIICGFSEHEHVGLMSANALRIFRL